MPKAIDSQITFLRTRDLATTSEFYEKTLGLSMVLDQGGCRIYKVAENAFVGFCEREETSSAGGVIITLVTQDVDGWYEKLRKAGVRFKKEPAYNPDYKIYHCFLRDPNGYMLEIQRFEDPRWVG